MSERTSRSRDRAASRRDLLRIVRRAVANGDLPPEAEQEALDRLDTLVTRFALTRRDLLKASVATAGLTLVVGEGVARLGRAGVADAATLLASPPTLTASVLRRDDMLALRFEFYNLVRDNTGALVRQNATQDAFIVATPGYGADHAPQNIGEEAFTETVLDTGTGPAGKPPGTVKAVLAGPSRLAFRVPATMSSVPFTLSSLLDFIKFELSVVPVALPPGSNPAVNKPTIREPLPTETSIETPWHMFLSPHTGGAWAHAATPVVRNGRTELWHTRLAVRKTPAGAPAYVDETDAAQRAVRAVWTTGFTMDGQSLPANPFLMSIKLSEDRWQVVRLSSDYDLPDYPPRTIDVNHLMLSALGAWQNTRGFFIEPPQGQVNFNLGEWRHISTVGRDQFVRIVKLGWLLPFGHPAAFVTITERKVQPVAAATGRAAYLRQRNFIVVRKPILDYTDGSPEPFGGRQMPYKTVELKTTVTPTLDDPDLPANAAWSFESFTSYAFIPVVAGQPLPFSIVGTDRDGQKSEFTLPLAYVSYAVDGFFSPAQQAQAIDDYIASTFGAGGGGAWSAGLTALMKTASLGGQKVGMAKSSKNENLAGGKPGDTTVEAKTISWNAYKVPDGDLDELAVGQARFFPIWTAADIRLNGVEQVAGSALSKTTIEPHATFLASGFSGNAASVFAKVTTPPDLSFANGGTVDRAGGLANLDMSIGGLSRTLGPVGGDVSTLPTQFDPAEFFDGAKILGGILLSDIIAPIDFGDLTKVPKLITETVFPDGDTLRPPEAVVTKVNFAPALSQDPLGIFDPTPSATMTIDATFRTPIEPPGEPTYEVIGDLRAFKVTLLGTKKGLVPLIALSFNQLKFTTRNGKKPNVDVDIKEVTFEGPLKFVNTLKDYLKLGSTGPSIDLTPTSVSASFAIPIPTVGVGVLTIQNIAFGAKLTIPFTGQPARVRFNFSEREDPFLVTVIGLGGGGFFALALGLDGLEIFEASIEVGASIALDLGVASGEVHALAGIYYKMERTPATDTEPEKTTALLEGYVRLGGSVNVLGIASVSVEFYLGMKYQIDTNELWGQASLTVEVEVLMFSQSFSFTVERRIAGSSGSSSAPFAPLYAVGGPAPKLASLAAAPAEAFDFTDLMNEDEWDAYTAAFATAA